MKKFVAIAACAFPLVFATSAYAQTTTAPATGGAGTATTPGTAAPAPTTPTTPPMTETRPGTPAPAGATPGVDTATEAITGWSVKDSFMGKAVVNEKDEKIGDIKDVVLSSDGKAVYLIIGAGGFLGMGERDVALPFEKLSHQSKKLVLEGYTKDQLKALPKVEVAK